MGDIALRHGAEVEGHKLGKHQTKGFARKAYNLLSLVKRNTFMSP